MESLERDLICIAIKLVARDSISKTLYIGDLKHNCVHVIPHSEFKKENSNAVYMSSRFIWLDDAPYFIVVLKSLLCIGLQTKMLVYSIESDPKNPTFQGELDLTLILSISKNLFYTVIISETHMLVHNPKN